MGNTQSDGVDIPVMVDGKYQIKQTNQRSNGTPVHTPPHTHTHNNKKHYDTHMLSKPSTSVTGELDNGIVYHTNAGNQSHSPHLQTTGIDQHDISMHDLQAQSQASQTSTVPALKLDDTIGTSPVNDTTQTTNQSQSNQHQQLMRPIETVPTAFKWTHSNHSPNSQVYLTGSFNNWQGKILMYKQEEGEYALIIDIPPGIHHYKYIVDGEWRLDEDAPTVVHNQVENNIIEVKRPVFEYTPASYADSDDDDQHQHAPYSQRAPLSSDYVQEPQKMPPHLYQSQVVLNHTSSQDPTWLPIPQHVLINHLYVLDGTQSDLVVTGITQRFKPNKQTRITHKFVTTVYYVPRQQFTNATAMPFTNHTQSTPNQLSLNIAHSSPATTPHLQPQQATQQQQLFNMT